MEIRKNRIRSGTIIEPAKRTFTTDYQIDTEAVSINHGIEAIDDLLHATSNRTKYITYLQHKENIQRYDIKGIAISSFDDNLLHIFIEEYRVSDNSSKRELALSLIGLNFADDRYSSNNEIAISIANLTALSDTLDQISKNESDQISIAINMSFVKEIKQLISRLKETLHK